MFTRKPIYTKPEAEISAYTVSYYDETNHGDPIAATSDFQTLIEAMNYGYLECYREGQQVLSICKIDLHSGTTIQLYNAQSAKIAFQNREHDEQMCAA